MHGCIKSEYKKRLIRRLKIMQGQIKGLEKAVLSEKYCVDVLNQSSAIQESLKSFDALMLENHLKTHILDHDKKAASEKKSRELLKIYKLNRK